jgi:hypothetical protein
MKNIEINKAVTTRFPLGDYLRIQQEAEKEGCTIADIIRKTWKLHQQQQHFQQQLLSSEQRQCNATFEILCSVIGLQEHERAQALQQLLTRGVKW